MTTEETSAEETSVEYERLERYCAAVVTALHEELETLDGIMDFEVWLPEPGDTGEKGMAFGVMYTNPESRVTHILWNPTEGWVYKLDDQSPGEPGHSMDVGSDEKPSYVAYVATMLIEQHVPRALPGTANPGAVAGRRR